jgi:hypothetical protein
LINGRLAVAKTDAEYQEYLNYIRQTQAPKATDDEWEAYAVDIGLKQPEPGLGMKALSAVGKGVDYAGGVTRAAAANIADAFVPGDIATKEDLLNALKANPPSTDEYLERSGIPEGYSLSDLMPSIYSKTGEGLPLKKGGALDPTTRGAAGFVGDVALDPLTYLSFGASGAAKQAAKTGTKLTKTQKATRAITNPIEALSEYAGKGIYKSGLKRIDQEAAKFGKEPVSDVLMKYGIAGSAKSIYNQMDDLAAKLSSEANNIIQEAAEKGATVSMKDAMKIAQDRVGKLRAPRDPKLSPIADSLDDEIKKYLDLDPRNAGGILPEGRPVTAAEANTYKQSIYKGMPKGAYQEMLSGKKPAYLAGEKDMARGLREGVESAVTATTGRGGELAQLNDELGRILTTADKQQLEAFKEANKNMMTSVDAPLAFLSPWAAVTKKAADIAKMTGTRTRTGKAMTKLGQGAGKGAHDIATRQLYIDLINYGNEDGE